MSENTRSQRERMLAGDPYVADDPELAALSARARRLQDAYHRASVAEDPSARDLLVDLLGECGDEVEVRPPLFVDYGEHLRIGARTFVNYNLTALDCALVTIGEDCQIGPGVQLLTATHPLEPGPRRDKVEAAEPITLGDNVWLGGGVIVCPGVSIGDDSVVGAGSVVTKDIPAGVVAVGNPARVIRSL
ncbi:MAG TPA: sugar O-acetyltransferase [Candidatus Janibacter merdipullorum]|nr:sugar O-acetyltransferase [Candidatus Janibacter merdipullorum]